MTHDPEVEHVPTPDTSKPSMEAITEVYKGMKRMAENGESVTFIRPAFYVGTVEQLARPGKVLKRLIRAIEAADETSVNVATLKAIIRDDRA